MPPADALSHCAALVREHAHDRFIAALFAPAEVRPLLYALYAFDWEIAQVAVGVREPLAGEIRLQWWRDVLNGERDEEARANPLAVGLKAVLDRHPGAGPLLQRLLDARAHDLYSDPIASVPAFETVADETAGNVLRVAAGIVAGFRERDEIAAARPAAVALRATEAIRDIAFDALRGRVQVPADLLAAEGLTPADVLAGERGAELQRVLTRFAEVALANLRAARAMIPQSPAAGPAFLELALVPATLKAAARRGDAVFRVPVALAGWRRQWLLWRAARRLP